MFLDSSPSGGLARSILMVHGNFNLPMSLQAGDFFFGEFGGFFYRILIFMYRLFAYGIGIHLLQAEEPENLPKKSEINPKDNHISFQVGF